ncbi:MAG: monofunctional biosynthetic peptidoglycan transglycosylase [Sphingomonadales bacterium]|nr:monofunctional biosynthetic peptidoglycan transglycosylase [Sphingomonadales bacterium]
MIRKIFRFFLGLWLFSLALTLLYRWVPVPFTPLMFLRLAQGPQEGQIHRWYRDWVPLEQISPNLIQAAVATEDQHFMEHHGFDFEALQKAYRRNQKGHKRIHGGSTISQQTAKNVFLWPARNYLRKALEAYFTVTIELLWSKRRIMEVYLNSIEMGPGIYGAEAASQIYFNRSAANLSKRQAALIVATFPNPRQRNPGKPSPYMQRRASKILRLMRQIGPTHLEQVNSTTKSKSSR